MSSTNKPMMALTKFVFWVVAVNALAGALSLIFFPTMTDMLFFWEIKPPINAGLFGALYLGGAVTVAWLTYRGEWEPARFLIPVLVSAGIFISITTLLHLDRFTPGLKLAWGLVVYMGAPLLALLFYTQHERTGANWTTAAPVRRATRFIAVALGGVLLILGWGLLISPTSVIASWPWPMTPLMLRIFASWFSAFGVGLWWFWFERDWQRLKYVANLMIAASMLDLLMIFVHRDQLTGEALVVGIYGAHLALLGVIGLLMHWLQRR
jgi:hypothetical protein